MHRTFIRALVTSALFSILLSVIVAPTRSTAVETMGYVEVEGTHFVLNGLPYYYTGSNTYYLMVYAAEAGLRSYVCEVLSEASEMGLKVVRTWAFNDGDDQWNALQTSPRVYNERVFRGLDYVVHAADSLGLRLILPFVNNWDDYGGMNRYVAWSPTASSHDDFYTDDSCRVWYKNHIHTILNRVNVYSGRAYRYDPAIFAWELGNEPRCTSDNSGDKLQGWIEEMSAYIKSVDPYHLVTVGLEGFYDDAGSSWWLNGSQGCDFIRNHQTSTVDFCTAHNWPDNWNWSYSTSMNFIEMQCDDAESIIGKPIILEEFGKYRDNGGGTTTRDNFFSGYYSTLAGHGGDGSNFWILYHDDYTDYDGYGVYYPDDSSTIAIIEAEVTRTDGLSPTSVPPPSFPEGQLNIIFNVPNPFNPLTTIHYYIPRDGRVVLEVCNVSGRRVVCLVNEVQGEGYHKVDWDGKNSHGATVESGVYFYRLSAGSETLSRKMILLR